MTKTQEESKANISSDLQLRYRLTSTTEFLNFLKRYISVGGELLMEIENGCIKAKISTPERNVVKSSKIQLTKIFHRDDVNNSNIDQPILLGIYSLSKLIKSISFFETDQLVVIFNLKKTSDGIIATEIILQDSSLRINFPCAELRLFTRITDEMMQRIADTDSTIVNFILTKEMQARINSLAAVDHDQKIFTINVENGKVNIAGNSYNLSLLDIQNPIDISLKLYKAQFAIIDREDSRLFISDDRCIINSIETDTQTIIGKVD